MKRHFAIKIAAGAFLFISAGNAFAAHITFSDIENHKYKAAIEFLQRNHVVNGYDDGTFRPDAEINRAELLTIIIGQNYSDLRPKRCFPDVKWSAWYSKFVCKGKELGIVSGYKDGTFQPNKNVNFVEALTVLLRAYKIPVDTAGKVWYEDSLRQGREMNIIPPDIKSNDAEITRGQMAEIMMRFMIQLVYDESLCSGKLDECVEKKVKVTGTVSNIIWQHMFAYVEPYTETSYLDDVAEAGVQVVIYTKKPLNVADGKKIEVIGKVVEVATEGTPGAKIDKPYAEYHILVDAWKEVQ